MKAIVAPGMDADESAPRWARRCAFTLLELLVVIAIFPQYTQQTDFIGMTIVAKDRLLTSAATIIKFALRSAWNTCLMVGLLQSQNANAANATWNGGGTDNNWSTPNNWGGSAPIANDNLIFSGANRQTSKDPCSPRLLPRFPSKAAIFNLPKAVRPGHRNPRSGCPAYSNDAPLIVLFVFGTRARTVACARRA